MDFKKSPPTHFEDVDDLDEEAAHKEIEALREAKMLQINPAQVCALWENIVFPTSGMKSS
jgi:hypothetical protein